MTTNFNKVLLTDLTANLLPGSRAARFPQQELLWDKSKLAFLNADGTVREDATKTCVTREYRKGFELPAVV